MIQKIFIVIFSFLLLSDSYAQELSDKEFLDVYLDCNFCNMSDIRNNISYINYVREAALSDVHVLATRISSGANGYKYAFRFIGRKDFAETELVRSFSETPDMILAERQKEIRNVLELGLTNFWAQTKMADRLTIKVSEDKKAEKAGSLMKRDPWHNWIFSIRSGISADFEAARKESRLWGRVSADRVTETWRIRNVFYARGDYQVIVSDEEEIRSNVYQKSASTTVVRSINDHWSSGIFLSASQSTFDNLDLSTQVAPAFEYSIFPYSEVQERELTVAYRVSHRFRDYTEETIYDELSEHLFGQSLVMSARFTQQWGNLYAQLEGSHYFHDIRQNRVEFESWLNVRIVKGLSISLGNNLEFIHDQRSLPKRDISLEELLLAQRQAATSFRMSGQMGINYTFGSIYNNVVNTRL
ncbi:MAG: hypothetical protein KDC80_22160 [Saprospiraceae bacterium]|nr:hypothetical protein [Saprospiraceae bacterium]